MNGRGEDQAVARPPRKKGELVLLAGAGLKGLWSAWAAAKLFPRFIAETDWVGFPDGVLAMPMPPLSLALVSPISSALSPEMGLVALVVLHTTLATCAGGVLARVLGARTSGVMMAGLFLATWPEARTAIYRGTLEYLTICWLAFMLAALVLVCRGRWRWGPVAGLLYVVTALECGLYGSAGALVVLVCVAVNARTRAAWGGLLLGGLTAFGLSAALWIPLAPLLAQLHSTPPPPPGIVASPADLFSFAPRPGAETVYPVTIVHWILLLGGLWASPRKLAWLAACVLVFLAFSLATPVVHPWMATPLGARASNVVHYLGPAGVLWAVIAGAGADALVRRVGWRPTALPGLALGSGLALVVLLSCGWWWSYPITRAPLPPEFVVDLTRSSDRRAVVVLQPAHPRTEVVTTPGYYSIEGEVTFLRNPNARLWLQTVLDRPTMYFPGLVSVALLSKPPDWLGRSPVSALEAHQVAWLRRAGFGYVLLDHQTCGGSLGVLRGSLVDQGASCREYDEWGGISVCRL